MVGDFIYRVHKKMGPNKNSFILSSNVFGQIFCSKNQFRKIFNETY